MRLPPELLEALKESTFLRNVASLFVTNQDTIKEIHTSANEKGVPCLEIKLTDGRTLTIQGDNAKDQLYLSQFMSALTGTNNAKPGELNLPQKNVPALNEVKVSPNIKKVAQAKKGEKAKTNYCGFKKGFFIKGAEAKPGSDSEDCYSTKP